jgi:prepilin-type N-terminal cleavage/methylation domain-containing protein
MAALWRHTRQKSGFTLLELLMVVIIIAILAAIALPQFIRAAEKARAAEAIQVLSALRGSEFRFKALSPTLDYTNNLLQLDADVTVMTNWAGPVAAVTPAGAGVAKGMITTNRTKGTFTGTNVGIQLGTGTICGSFPPMGTPACVQD